MSSETVQGAPYRLQTQGQIERFNRTLNSKLRKYLSDDDRRYIEVLDEIVFQYNKTKHKSTKVCSFVLFKVYDPSNSNWHLQDNFFEIQQIKNNYARYVEGYKRAYDERMNTQTIALE
ncbi:Transposon Tf2-6 polyprotein [Cucumispora dikerogammari]|nr:Transposon Tf2-6 polyprotein [Cucumispora dikerogammari]